MKVIADVSVLPIGTGPSVSQYIVECERIFRQSGLTPNIHAEGTEVEGEWDQVVGAVRLCHERVHEMGVPRIDTIMKINTRSDRDESADRMIKSVKDKMKAK